MLSQFTREAGNKSLADLDFVFPHNVYPIGRLDTDSEGLLLLSNDPSLNQELLPPHKSHWRKYYVQVEGDISLDDCKKLETGVTISIKGKKYKTLSCIANLLEQPENLAEREPPIRIRKNIPTSWLSLELKEGKNRQVRKMTASIGFPTLRLLRRSIESIELSSMKPGEVMEYERAIFLDKLKIIPKS